MSTELDSDEDQIFSQETVMSPTSLCILEKLTTSGPLVASEDGIFASSPPITYTEILKRFLNNHAC